MKTIITQGIIEGIRAKKDRSISFTASTPEFTQEEKAIFFELQGISLEFTIKPLDEPAPDVQKVDKELNRKSLSERLRNVMFVVWKQNNTTQTTFDEYYRLTMENIIEKFKAKIEENV